MKNKKLILCISSLAAITFLTTGCKDAKVKDGQEVAVSVKGTKITATEYYNQIKTNNISKLIDMIDHGLFDEKYKTDAEEDKSVETQIEQLKSNYGSDESTFNNILTQYFGVNNEEELEKMLRLEYKRNLAVEDYIKDSIKDDEIQKYYDENIFGDIKASHILIKTTVSSDATTEEKEKAEEEALKKAKEIIKKLDKGEDFAKLAKKYSDDTSNASNGGDLGYFSTDEMVEEFSNAAKTLKKNEYTKEPVKTEYGYHIILKTGEKSKPKLKEVKSEIKEKITEQRLSNDSTLYYQTLMDIREDNNIKWNDSKLKKQYKEFMEKLIETASNSSTTK